MLIAFKFGNFLSYKDENRLLMTPVKSFKEHIESNTLLTEKGLRLLKTAAIYGSNGGGKSNFISAMAFMSNTVFNSFGNSLKKDKDIEWIDDYYYKLSQGYESKPSMFEVTFVIFDVIYRYGFEIEKRKIVSEWLYKKVETETMLFERTGMDYNINSSGFPEGNKYKDEVNENVLMLSHLAQHNAAESKLVFAWFKQNNVISGLDDWNYSSVTGSLINENPEFRKWLTLALKFLEITKVDTIDDTDDIITYHNKYDQNNVIVGTVSFDLLHEESQGTRKLIYLLGTVYDTLMYGKVLFIDELDSKLHPNLTRRLLEFFHKINLGAQFIFTLHDATLLDKSIFRRDQLWFVDRNRFGASELYSMSEFDSSVVRKDSDFQKKYLQSKFGAAETMDITDELVKLTRDGV